MIMDGRNLIFATMAIATLLALLWPVPDKPPSLTDILIDIVKQGIQKSKGD